MGTVLQESKIKDMWLDRAAQFLSSPFTRASNIVNVAALVAVSVIMFLVSVDVTLRYFFGTPIVGSYELVQIMMSILVAFSLAYCGMRKGHVTIDILTSHLSERGRAFVNSITWIVSLCIFGLITWRTLIYATTLRNEGATTSALYIPLWPFVYVVAFGSASLCLVFLKEMFEHLSRLLSDKKVPSQVGLLTGILVVIAIFSAPIWATKFGWHIDPGLAGILGIIVLILMTFSGMYVGTVMALVGFWGLVYMSGLSAALNRIGNSPFTDLFAYGMSVVPLFILMGEFCFHSGISKDLFNTAYKWMGHLPGGVAMTTVGACAGFAAVCGSGLAEVAMMSTVALPEMKKYKYSSTLATGSITCAGCLGILIPPSTIMVIYGIIAEQSIGKLFLAGFIPGIIQALFYIAIIYIICKRNPLIGPPGRKSTMIERVVSLKDTWVVLALFLLVIGGLYIGVFTPTEAGAVGALGAFLFALGNRKLSWRNFIASLRETSKMTAMIFFLLIGATLLGYFLTITRLPNQMADFVSGLQISRYIILAAIILVYLFLGTIMSSIVMVIITVPIFLPAVMILGFDPIWFGIIIVEMVEIASITPPYAMNLFVMQAAARDVGISSIYKGIIPFLFMDLLHVALITAFPAIVLFLPSFVT